MTNNWNPCCKSLAIYRTSVINQLGKERHTKHTRVVPVSGDLSAWRVWAAKTKWSGPTHKHTLMFLPVSQCVWLCHKSQEGTHSHAHRHSRRGNLGTSSFAWLKITICRLFAIKFLAHIQKFQYFCLNIYLVCHILPALANLRIRARTHTLCMGTYIGLSFFFCQPFEIFVYFVFTCVH